MCILELQFRVWACNKAIEIGRKHFSWGEDTHPTLFICGKLVKEILVECIGILQELFLCKVIIQGCIFIRNDPLPLKWRNNIQLHWSFQIWLIE